MTSIHHLLNRPVWWEVDLTFLPDRSGVVQPDSIRSHVEISEAENDPLGQNVKVSKLSEKKEILQNVTTGLVYTFKQPTKEDADSKSLVPKILHFIWMGSSVKQAYLENIVTWRLNNPSYKVLTAIQK